jgi:C-terminal processing protease CtpA/Prc
VCWKNDLERKTIVKNGKPFLNVRGHEIEVMALKEVVAELKGKRGQKVHS